MAHYKQIEDFYSGFFKTVSKTAYNREVQAALVDFNPGKYLIDFSFYTDEDRKFRFIRDQILGPHKYNETMNSLSSFRLPIIDNLAAILDYRNEIDSSIHLHSVTDARRWLPGNEQALNKIILNISVLQTIYSSQVMQINNLKQKAIQLVNQISQEYK